MITNTSDTDPRNDIATRVDALMIKLLEGVERDIACGPGALPGPHLAAYEALCRAEALRLGS
jgi:hypothetical protein